MREVFSSRRLRWRTGVLALLGTLAWAGGCATSPAQPSGAEAATVEESAAAPDGMYRVVVTSRFTGPIVGIMAFEPLDRPPEAEALPQERTDGEVAGSSSSPAAAASALAVDGAAGALAARPERFRANTRPGVAWTMVGGFEAALGRVFAPFLFPHGMILTWESTLARRVRDGEGRWKIEAGEGSLGVGSLASLRVKTRQRSLGGPHEVLLRDGRAIARVTLEPVSREQITFENWNEDTRPKTGVDYPSLAAAARRELGPAMLGAPASTAAIEQYFADLDGVAVAARDDVEFLFGSLAAARKQQGLNWPLIAPREDPSAWERWASDDDDTVGAWKVTRDDATRIVTVRVDAFLEPEAIERLVEHVESLNPRGVVLDLRTSPGLTLGAAVLGAALVGAPTEWGTYFAESRRAELSKAEPRPSPPVGEVSVASARDVDEAMKTLETSGAVRVSLRPRGSALASVPLAVLVSRRTGGTSEHLVRAVRESRRGEGAATARVFGERSAGRLLLPASRDLGQGWVLRLAGYGLRPVGWTGALRISDLRRAENGVEPDERVAPNDAPKRAERWLIE